MPLLPLPHGVATAAYRRSGGAVWVCVCGVRLYPRGEHHLSHFMYQTPPSNFQIVLVHTPQSISLYLYNYDCQRKPGNQSKNRCFLPSILCRRSRTIEPSGLCERFADCHGSSSVQTRIITGTWWFFVSFVSAIPHPLPSSLLPPPSLSSNLWFIPRPDCREWCIMEWTMWHIICVALQCSVRLGDLKWYREMYCRLRPQSLLRSPLCDGLWL